MVQFYKCDHGKIYKYRENKNDYFLLTPWEIGEDKVCHSFSELKHPININKHKANNIINEIWRNTTFYWKHNGKKYCTKENAFNGEFNYYKTSSKNILKNSPWHEWYFKYTLNENSKVVEKIHVNRYKLAMYRGNIVWVVLGQYLPRVYCYKFININTEPSEFACWTGIKSLQSIYCLTDKCYI